MNRLHRWAAALVGLLLLARPAAAAPPPTETFFRDPDLLEAVLSPTGRQLAFLTARGGTRVGLAVFDLNTGQVRRVAQFNDGDVSRVHWVNDTRLLFSVVDFSEGSGRPNGAPGLFAINADGSEPRQLVLRMNRPNVTYGDSGRKRMLDWNHVLLRVPRLMAGSANEEILVAHVETNERRLQTPLWLNTRTGRTRSLDIKVPDDTVGWLTDGRGELRVALTRREGRVGALWRGPGSSDWQPLFEAGPFNSPFTPRGVDNAGQLYVTHASGKAGEQVLSRYDFDRRAPHPKPLVVTPGFDFSGALIDDGDDQALGVRVLIDGETTVWLHPAMKALQDEADAQFPGRINRINCRRCGAPDMVAVVRSHSDRDPGQVWLYRAQPPQGEKPWRAVGRVRDDVKPSEMALLEFRRITARDGRDLPVWVTRPANATGALPAVVLVHGGPWVRGSSWRWNGQAQFLASRGFVVIEPEFRGSTGYGSAHYRAGFKQWGQAMQDDVADALKWAQKEGLASDKACIAGGSYGGYSTLMGLIKDPDLYRCGVAWVAVTDLELLLKGSWWVNDDTSDESRRHRLPESIGDLEKDAAMIIANSPVRQAARVKAPVLLAFGEQDLRVPLAHGKRMRDALTEAGNPPEWVTYPGEGHGFSIIKNRVDFAERMAAFLAKHLQP
ncbi:prolyl oligopeptidase family serine peptidase [Roseateles asaccharophilus]|uniref:Dipeptidyl aminopeptidase/acylaminoacyl peptidase n=1 Tax=Roseateles asaccharophilus TaxID=582607 RepID=A0ABU2A380_9BURK|nr:prolyl oligopeptidase family serine peptidase [Roseateles asaccharophilus]MDR7331621.1 dipeptidyl aminopeptidase/acylaminoacyl peptidase [Roseateles asaccharophilus]